MLSQAPAFAGPLKVFGCPLQHTVACFPCVFCVRASGWAAAPPPPPHLLLYPRASCFVINLTISGSRTILEFNLRPWQGRPAGPQTPHTVSTGALDTLLSALLHKANSLHLRPLTHTVFKIPIIFSPVSWMSAQLKAQLPGQPEPQGRAGTENLGQGEGKGLQEGRGPGSTSGKCGLLWEVLCCCPLEGRPGLHPAISRVPS